MKKILVADNEQAVRKMFTSILRLLSCEVWAVEDGKRALEVLEQERFDLEISDYQMPGMNGKILLEKIRQKFPDLPLVMISGADERHIGKMDGIPFLKKPVRLAALTELMEKLLSVEKPRLSLSSGIPP